MPKKKATDKSSSNQPAKKAAKKTTARKTAKKKTKAADRTAKKKTASVVKKATRKQASKAAKPVKKATEKQPAPKSAEKTGTASRAAAKSENGAETRPARKTGKTLLKKKKVISFTLDEAKEIARQNAQKKENPEASVDRKSDETGKPAAAQKKIVDDTTKTESRSFGAASLNDILGWNPSSGRPKNEEEEIPKKFSKYYKMLVELRRHVTSGLETHTKDTLKRSSKDDTGDLSSYSQHMADVGTDTFDRDFALSLVSTEQEALLEIEEAIKRIKKGTYGICEMTGKPIPRERLLAVPFARHSVEGQVEYEKTHRRSVQRGGGIFADASPEDSAQFIDDDSED